MMRKRFCAILICFCFAISLMQGIVMAADKQQQYLALGDGITTGYKLQEDEKDFSELLAEKNFLQLTKLARDDVTSVDLLEMVMSTANQKVLSEADVITVTVGSNDLMNSLCEYLARIYNEKSFVQKITVDQMKKKLLVERDSQMLEFAYYNGSAFIVSDEAVLTLEQINTNMSNIIHTIKKVNPDVLIIIPTLYNPYAFAAEQVDDNRFATAVNDLFESCVKIVNQQIVSNSSNHGYLVADVYTAFKNSTFSPCNASFDAATAEHDFHPNAYGHELIANTINNISVNSEKPEVANTGWVCDKNGIWYYLDENGDLVTNRWIKWKTDWYYLDGNGAMLTNGWVCTNDAWYYLTDSGKMAVNCWVKWKEEWYFMYPSGVMATSTTIDSFYIDSNGVWVQ